MGCENSTLVMNRFMRLFMFSMYLDLEVFLSFLRNYEVQFIRSRCGSGQWARVHECFFTMAQTASRTILNMHRNALPKKGSAFPSIAQVLVVYGVSP